MPYFLSRRDTKSVERMDDPDCSQRMLFNTYRQFSTINSMISGWKTLYKKRLKPLFRDQNRVGSLLDIGFGGGDIPLKLAKWAAQDGISLEITAIETDPRALMFANSLDKPQNVHFRKCSSSQVVEENQQFDVVISNHLLHHLDAPALQKLLKESQTLSKKLVLFNDLERSDIAYGFFSVFARPLFRRSFITEDGLTSIKRSFTRNELRSQVSQSWNVERLFPFRLLLSYEK